MWDGQRPERCRHCMRIHKGVCSQRFYDGIKLSYGTAKHFGLDGSGLNCVVPPSRCSRALHESPPFTRLILILEMDVLVIRHVGFSFQLSLPLTLLLGQALLTNDTGASPVLPNICISWSAIIHVITSAGVSYNKSATPQTHRTRRYTKPHKQ